MKIITHSIIAVVEEPLPKNCYIISITETDECAREMREKLVSLPTQEKVFSLVFTDDEEAFTETHAATALKVALEAVKNQKDLVIHCFAGVSRSVGLALALSEIVEGFDSVLMDGYLKVDAGTYSLYNKHVYRTTKRLAYS